MSKRKNLFEILVEKGNVNFVVEYVTINKLLRQMKNVNNWDSIFDAIDCYIIHNWKYGNRCIELEDLRKKLGITDFEIRSNDYPAEKCLLFFELIYNLVQILISKYEDKADTSIRIINDYDVYKIISNIEEILDELNYKIEKIEDRYMIVEKDNVVIAVAEKNIDISGDIIEYRRFNLKGDVRTKKDIILKLAERIEPLRKKFKGTNYNPIMEDVQMLLNNLNLRHNNLEGKNKREIIIKMSNEELEMWYDRLYDMILNIFQINDYLTYSSEIDELKNNLK